MSRQSDNLRLNTAQSPTVMPPGLSSSTRIERCRPWTANSTSTSSYPASSASGWASSRTSSRTSNLDSRRGQKTEWSHLPHSWLAQYRREAETASDIPAGGSVGCDNVARNWTRRSGGGSGASPRVQSPQRVSRSSGSVTRERAVVHDPPGDPRNLGEALGRDLVRSVEMGVPGRVVEIDHVHRGNSGVEERHVVVGERITRLIVKSARRRGACRRQDDLDQ